MMKNRLSKILVKGLFLVAAGLSIYSCKDTLDVKPEEVLLSDQVFNTKNDADVAIEGLYSQLFSIGDRYIIYNELRADLVDVTTNASDTLRQINEHNVKSSDNNAYADPYPFYKVINSCNNILSNLDRMYKNNILKGFEYNQRYADVGALRTWLYFQLAMNFDKLPYVTTPLVSVDALKDSLNYPLVENDQLIDLLVNFMETKVMSVYPGHYTDLSLSSYSKTIQGTLVSPVWIPKYALMGDLYLWKNQYHQAALMYKAQIDEYGLVGLGTNDNFRFNVYRISSFCPYSISYSKTDAATVPTEDINSINRNWRNQFKGDASAFISDGNNYLLSEWLWVTFMEDSYTKTNPFIDLFSNTQGRYLLKPSKAAIDNWKSQTQINGFQFDARGDSASYWVTNGQPVVMKYSYDYDKTKPLQVGGKFLLYRSALLQLRYAEAANRDRRSRIAWACLNQGIPIEYNTTGNTNRQTFDVAPYDLSGANKMNYNWDRNSGIRNRAHLQKLPMPAWVMTTDDSIQYIEEKLIDEGALELAFEGNRWGDLVRIAKRKNEPAYLADKVYQKLAKAGNAQASAVRARLMDPKNWYLPFPTSKSKISK